MNKPTVGTVVKVVKSGNRYNAFDAHGTKSVSYTHLRAHETP